LASRRIRNARKVSKRRIFSRASPFLGYPFYPQFNQTISRIDCRQTTRTRRIYSSERAHSSIYRPSASVASSFSIPNDESIQRSLRLRSACVRVHTRMYASMDIYIIIIIMRRARYIPRDGPATAKYQGAYRIRKRALSPALVLFDE